MTMSMHKVFHKKNPVCKVTFKLNKEVATSAMQVNLVGDFNNWDKENLRMKKSKTGGFSIAVNLDIGKEYEFKYLIDKSIWLNEAEADKQVSNVFHGTNSVVTV